MRDELLKAGRVRPHHVLPSSGRSRPIGSEQDADDVIALLRLNYDRAVAAAGRQRGRRPLIVGGAVDREDRAIRLAPRGLTWMAS